MYGSRLLHKRNVKFRGDSTSDLTVIAREATIRCSGRRRAPKMLGSIKQPRSIVFGKDGSTPTVPFRENDFVEEFDGGVFGTCGFTLVDEFVEHLCFAHHVYVFGGFAWHASHELIHVEVVHHACFSALA